MSTTFATGDQFVGFRVDPTTGDLVLRYTVVVTDTPDGNGRGVTRDVMVQNKTIARGRPMIFAPNVIDAKTGVRGHTNFMSKDNDPYKYEVGRILNLEPANKNLFERWKRNMIQTNSNYGDLVKSEEHLWVIDVIVTNEQAKNIWLNPATSHLIPRYVSPSFIHPRRSDGDYSRVNDAILDHVAVVKKPLHDPLTGAQIDGAAYGEVTRMRGACFGDKVACLNLLQTSSNKVVERDKCVSCPTQLLDRLTALYSYIDIVQTGSSNDMSTNNNNQSTESSEVTTGKSQVISGSTQQPDNTSTATVTTASPLGAFYKSDESMQKEYNALKGIVTQIIKEVQPNSTVIDATKDPNEQQSQGGTNTTENKEGGAENIKAGESQQGQQQEISPETNKMMKELQDKLNIKEEDIKTMKFEDIKTRFADISNVVNTVMQEQQKQQKTLQQMKAKEDKAKLSTILPIEAFTDERGIKQKEYEEMIEHIYRVQNKQEKLGEDYVKLIGVGLVAMRNEQAKLNESKRNLKANPSIMFGDSLKQQQQQQAPTPQQQ